MELQQQIHKVELIKLTKGGEGYPPVYAVQFVPNTWRVTGHSFDTTNAGILAYLERGWDFEVIRWIPAPTFIDLIQEAEKKDGPVLALMIQYNHDDHHPSYFAATRDNPYDDSWETSFIDMNTLAEIAELDFKLDTLRTFH